MSTVTEIARIAGVSKMAVSYAFSSDPQKRNKISPATRQKISLIAEQMDYHPSMLGRGLSLSRSYTLALLLPKSTQRNISEHTLGIFHGISMELDKSEYNLAIFFGWDKKFSNAVKSRRIDGVIMITSMTESPFFDKIDELNLPFVLVNRPQQSSNPLIGSVCSDFASCIASEINRFAANNVSEAILYCGNMDLIDNSYTAKIFLEECRKFNLKAAVKDIGHFDPSEVTGNHGVIFRGIRPEVEKFLASASDMPSSPAVLVTPQLIKKITFPEHFLRCNTPEDIGLQSTRMLLEMIEQKRPGRQIMIPLTSWDSYSEQKIIPRDF